MFKYTFAVILLIAAISCAHCADSNKCIESTSCSCHLDSYRKIDISSVLGDYTQLEDSKGNITYYFLGCKNKKFPANESITSSLIKYNKTDNVSSAIGDANKIKFEFNSTQKSYELVYNEKLNDTTAFPIIRLICDDFEVPFIKIINEKSNSLVLSSPKVCVVTEHQGLSGGSILLLIFFISVGIYFLGGALLLYFIRGARGVEVIPNLDFWKNLPGLVKDGVIFLLSGCKPTLVATAETYDRI